MRSLTSIAHCLTHRILYWTFLLCIRASWFRLSCKTPPLRPTTACDARFSWKRLLLLRSVLCRCHVTSLSFEEKRHNSGLAGLNDEALLYASCPVATFDRVTIASRTRASRSLAQVVVTVTCQFLYMQCTPYNSTDDVIPTNWHDRQQWSIQARNYRINPWSQER